ncbi:MAG: DUF433 domain-containing protein, partial [Candidatus Poribacteria bacterium]
MEKYDRITTNPDGSLTIRDTKIAIIDILEMIANNKSDKDVIEKYKELEADDIQQAMRYATWTVYNLIRVTAETTITHPYDIERHRLKNKGCFVIMPFSPKFDLVYETIKEALDGI